MSGTLTVTASHDYSGETLTDIADILFATSAVASATFVASQFVVGTISPTVQITGDANANDVTINVAAAGTFTAAGWTFANWTGDAVTILGAAGAETIIGSNQANQIEGGDGADYLTGGNSDDVFRYFHSAQAIGAEHVVGGGGSDTLVVADTVFGGDFDFSGASLSSVEGLAIIAVGFITVTLAGHQIGAGAITGVGVIPPPFPGPPSAISLHVNGSSVNLSGVTFVGPIGISIFGSKDTPSSLIGSSLADTIIGSNQKDTINGWLGADYMAGGGGDDTYTVDDVGDVVDETADADQGTDLIKASVTFSLADSAHAHSVENLTLTGVSNLNGTGTDIRNLLVGNSGRNTLLGAGGNDGLTGGADNDKLIGGAGNDKLAGGNGIDRLTGGLDNDVFVFSGPLISAINVDHIVDFNYAHDKLNLTHTTFKAIARGGLSPDAFHLGIHAADAEDRLIYDRPHGKLYYDRDGTGSAAAVLFSAFDNHAYLSSAQFLIVA